MEPRYVIGIDLGTTNSALSYVEYKPDADPFALPKVELLGIPQLVNPSEVRDEGLLPSFLYVPGATDFPAGATALPWDAEPDTVVGRLAQKRGVGECRPPGILGQIVALARRRGSHRAHPALPRARRRAQDSRPWKPAAAIWTTCGRPGTASMPDAPFTEQQVLVTVPASFDAVARELDPQGRRAGRLPEPHPARRAAGRILRLDRAPPGLARARPASAT